jgi:hypothetical protein
MTGASLPTQVASPGMPPTFLDRREAPGVTMNQLLFPLPGVRCPAARCCDKDLCFQAWLEAAADTRQARLATGMCAQHWGEAIHALTAWALAQGMSGQLTILAADGSSPGQAAIPRDQMPAGFAFTTIKFRPADPGIRGQNVVVVRAADRVDIDHEDNVAP